MHVLHDSNHGRPREPADQNCARYNILMWHYHMSWEIVSIYFICQMCITNIIIISTKDWYSEQKKSDSLQSPLARKPLGNRFALIATAICSSLCLFVTCINWRVGHYSLSVLPKIYFSNTIVQPNPTNMGNSPIVGVNVGSPSIMPAQLHVDVRLAVNTW